MRHKLCNCLPILFVEKNLSFVLSNNMPKVPLSQTLQILFTFKVCNFIVSTLYSPIFQSFQKHLQNVQFQRFILTVSGEGISVTFSVVGWVGLKRMWECVRPWLRWAGACSPHTWTLPPVCCALLWSAALSRAPSAPCKSRWN